MQGINPNLGARRSAAQNFNPAVVGQNAAAAKSQGAARPTASAVDGFARLTAPAIQPRRRLGLSSRAQGFRAGLVAGTGFKVQQALTSAKRHVKGIAIASAIGFALLVPPGVGQIMHPGFPGSKTSPVAVQMVQMQKLPAAQRVRQQVDAARKAIPSGTGTARQKAVLGLIHQYQTAKANAAKADTISGEAQTAVKQMRKSVSWDARAGYAIDWYWFGVPEQNAFYHAGTKDATTLSKTASADEQAASYANNAARGEVSNLLAAESPAYARLHAKYVHTGDQLTAAETIQRKAERAASDLSYADHAIEMRNLTPQTVEQQYQDSNGNYYTETVTNPDWTYWHDQALLAKSNAEDSVRALNREISRDSQLLNLSDMHVDAHLITAWDFIGQPSFAIWSFDQMQVSQARDAADGVAEVTGHMISQIKPQFQQLQSQVNQKIDARWQQLVQSNLNS